MRASKYRKSHIDDDTISFKPGRRGEALVDGYEFRCTCGRTHWIPRLTRRVMPEPMIVRTLTKIGWGHKKKGGRTIPICPDCGGKG